MGRAILFVILLLGNLFGATIASAQTSNETQGKPAGVHISGRVLSADSGRPLPKATVSLTRNDGTRVSYVARADSNGAFQFSEIEPGRYRLQASRSGYVSQIYGQRGGGPGIVLTVETGQKLERLEFRLERAGVISGTVTDEDNEPVEGLVVRAQRVSFTPGGRQQVTTVRTSRTDDLGNYRLYGLAPGFYYVVAGGREEASIGSGAPFGYAPTFYPGVAVQDSADRVKVAAGEEVRRVDVPVRSRPTFSISGVIVDSSPLPGRRGFGVGITSGGSTAMTVASQDGTFNLRGVEAGEYTLTGIVYSEGTAQRRGYRRVRVEDADVRVVIEIGQAAEVQGRVTIDDGEGISLQGLRVFLRPEIESGTLGASQVEADGRFMVRDVTEGSYTFEIIGRSDEVYLKSARCGAEDFTIRPVELTKDHVLENCELTLGHDLAQISGFVNREGEPVAGSVVVLIPAELERRKIPRHTGTAQTDATGAFLLRGVIPGDYFAFAVLPTGDSAYYDTEFPERNRDKAERIIVKPGKSLALNLKLFQPR